MLRGANGEIAFRATLDTKALEEGANRARGKFSEISSAASREGEKMQNALSAAGRAAGAFFSVQAATGFVRKLVEVRGEIQMLETSFATLLGSSSAAGALMAELKEFAASTPLELQDLAKAAQTMLGFNIAAEDLMPLLKALGDISMGDAQRFQSLALAFSQTQAAGKLMGQDLLQMINVGFNPLSIISAQTEESIGALKEEMAAGAISAEAVKRAFMDAASEGGKFYGMLESQSTTVKGAISNLSGAITDMLNEMGENSEGLIAGTVQTLQWLVEHYKQIGEAVALLAATYGTYRAVLIATAAIERAQRVAAIASAKGYTLLGLALEAIQKKQLALNRAVLANPYVLLAAAIVGAVYAVYKIATAEDAAEVAQRRYNDRLEEGRKAVEAYRGVVEEQIAIIKDETATQLQRVAAYEKLLQLLPQLQGYTLEEVAGMDPETLSRLKNESADRKAAEDLAARLTEAREELRKAQESFDATAKYSRDYFSVSAAEERVEAARENLRLVEADVKAREELEERARFEALSDEEKSARLQAQLEALEAQRRLAVDMLPTKQRELYLQGQIAEALTDSTTAAGFFSAQVAGVQGRIISISNTIDATRGKLARLTDSENAGKSYSEALKEATEEFNAAKKALEESTKGSEAGYLAARERLKAAKDALEALGGETSMKTRTRGEDPAVEERKRLQQLEELRRQAAKKRQREEIDNEHNIQRARVSAMEEGLEKELALAQLESARLLEENRRRGEDWVAEIQEQQKRAWEIQNPEKAKQGFIYPGVATLEDLTGKQKQQLQEYENIARGELARAEDAALAQRLEQVETYSQARERILREYAARERELYEADGKTLRRGVTAGNLEELQRQQAEALKTLDRTYAEKQEAFVRWSEELQSLTLAQLEKEFARVAGLFATLKTTSGASPESMAEISARLDAVGEKLKAARAEAARPGKSAEEWQALSTALGDARGNIEEVAEALAPLNESLAESLRGLAGLSAPIISIISSIGQFAEYTRQGIASTATAAGKAIAIAERGTVILTIISAALKIAQEVSELVNDDKYREENIESLQNAIEDLQWRLNNIGFETLEASAGRPLEHLREWVSEATVEAVALASSFGGATEALKTLKDVTAGTAGAAEKLAQAYMRADYMAGKALGAERYSRVSEELENIARQIALIAIQKDEESRKKNADTQKLEEYDRKVRELATDLAGRVDEIFSDLLGGDAESISEQLGNALFDAFSRGEDAAAAFGATVDKILTDMTRRLLVQEFLEKPVQEAINKIKQAATEDGQLDLYEFYNLLPTLQEELNNIGAAAKNMPNILDGILSALGIDPEEPSGSSSSRRGITADSQDSIGELSGRALAIQLHTAKISAGTAQLQTFSRETLDQVRDIARLVKEGNATRTRLEKTATAIESKMQNWNLYGVKIK